MPERGEGPTPGNGLFPGCRPTGDRHLTLEVGDAISPELNDLVYAAEDILWATRPPGLCETTPAYCSLLVRYNPLETDYHTLARVCLGAARAAVGRVRRAGGGSAGPPGAGAEVAIPVVYGGEWGPDLEDVARHTGLSPEEVAARHAAGLYRVYMIGFAPGFGYLGGMDPALATPRRSSPRAVVPEGSVGIAGEQTGVYPGALPGGWQIIGRTPLKLWDPEAEAPAVLAPGRRVRFVDAGPGVAGWARATELATAAGAGGRSAGAATGAPHPSPAALGVDVALVRRAGPLDTVQDAGRWGHSRLGLPESGAMDWPSLAAANLAVGNDPGAAALEVTYGGLRLEFVAPATVAVSPGGAAVFQGEVLAAGRATMVGPGDTLEFRPGPSPRTYLAFGGGGVACPALLGSRSTYGPAGLGGLEGRSLRTGDHIPAYAAQVARAASARGGASAGATGVQAVSGRSGKTITVRAVPGPQEHLFAPEAFAAFFASPWRVLGGSDRRACLLEGQALAAPAGSGISDGSPAGAVQVVPSGQPLVLLADHQTTGGYPKIATVVALDLPLLGQAMPGDEVRFSAVEVSVANSAWLALPPKTAGAWPGNRGAAASDEVGARRQVMLLGLRGRSHLIALEPAPPR